MRYDNSEAINRRLREIRGKQKKVKGKDRSGLWLAGFVVAASPLVICFLLAMFFAIGFLSAVISSLG